jgi:hypothetical protein
VSVVKRGKSFKQTGRSIPPKRAGAHNRAKGYFARLVEGEVFDGRPRSRGKEEVVIGTRIIVGRKSALKPEPTIGSSGCAGPTIPQETACAFHRKCDEL